MRTRIIKLYSDFAFCVSVFERLLGLAIIIYLITVFNENPIVVSIAIAFFFSVLLVIGNDEISLYNDQLVIADTSFLTLLINRHREYMLTDFTHAALPDTEKPGAFSIGVIAILAALTPRRYQSSKTIFLLYKKDGSRVEVSTDLAAKKIKLLITHINKRTGSR